VEEGGELVW